MAKVEGIFRYVKERIGVVVAARFQFEIEKLSCVPDKSPNGVPSAISPAQNRSLGLGRPSERWQ